MHTGVREEVREPRRKEFAGVIGVESAYQAVRLSRPFIQEGGKRGNEFANIMRSLGFASHGIRGFVPRVVVNENEE
eukprot:1885232-Pleurochrysis_carterae.AAC.1